MSNEVDPCKGCNSIKRREYSNTSLCLVYLVKYELGGCPCMECLLKSMCSSQCKARVDFFSKTAIRFKDKINQAYREREAIIK